MDFRVLGSLEVERDGEALRLGGRKQRSVLAVLVLRAREVIDPERLADAIWDGEPPASAETTLRGYISNLRRTLEPTREAGDEPKILRTTPAGYVLDVADDQIDARRFERLVAAGRDRRTSEVSSAVESLTQALSLWRGDAYQDFAYSTFVQTEAARLTELRFACLEDLFDAQIEIGHHDAVVGELEAFCSSHPSREKALRLLMLALYRCGRQADALRVYEEGRSRLAQELGIDPSPELRAVYEQILRQEDALNVAAPSDAAIGRQTLTFLLGDVERSTEKLRALGDDYASVLEHHRRELQDAFRSFSGRAIRTWGDGMFAAFDCATDAMAAAVAAQRAIGRPGLDEERRLPVRMGLHTGEATFSGGEYVGLSIHLAARIMDAAYGDQVLVSHATKELFEAEEGADIELADVGRHVLKDIPDTVHLFQVVHPELRRDFPPLRTRAERTDNLPQRPTSFVGRRRDLEEIETTFAEAKVVTLTGVGGVGKTRLAIEAGRRLAPGYRDGVWLCELAPVGDAGGLVHSVATTLRVEQQPGRSMRDSLLVALRQRCSLLILDNCEHLLEPVAELLEDVVAECPDIDVLTTSREAIGVEGERSRPVRSLRAAADDASSDAMRLFADRARDVRPDFAVDERTASEVAGICNRLDGIPLAIELAAARVTSLSPAQIAKRLEEGFHFLRSGRRAAVDRHRTLHGAIDWSYAMLTDAECTLFDRLSVFAGGFTLETAEDVCGRDLPLDVADGLASLVAKSMVDADVTGDEARYVLLETMRQYGQDRLEERGEAGEILRAHSAHFVDLMEELGDLVHVSSETVMPRLAVEFDNMRAAQAWAREAGDTDLAMRIACQGPLWIQLQYPEMVNWAEQSTTMPGAEDHDLLPIALMLVYLGRRAGMPGSEELAARIFKFVDDPVDEKRMAALLFAALWETNRGRMEEGARWMDELIRVAGAIGAPLGWQVFGLAAGGMAASNARDHAAGVELAEAGCALAQRGSTAVQGIALYYLGEAVLAAGEDPDRAREHLDRALELFRDNAMHFWMGVTLVAQASLRARHGDPREALPLFRDLLDRWRRLGDWARQWVTVRNLAELFGRLEVDHAAAALMTASLSSASAPPNIGAQSERLEELRQVLNDRMGDEAFTTACEKGQTMSDAEAVAFAKAEVDRAIELSPAEA